MKISKTQTFWPYLLIVFFNTFIDLGHKILIQDTLYQTMTGSAYTMMSAVINGFILLPYILLFTPSGFIADKFSKTRVLKITAACAIPLTILVTYFYWIGNFYAAFFMTLLLAVQSALNSPAKYGYIKDVFSQELTKINTIVQTLTLIAILSATVIFTGLFSYMIKLNHLQMSVDKTIILQAFAPIGLLLIVFSLFETAMTFRLLNIKPADPHSEFKVVPYIKGAYLRTYLAQTQNPKVIFISILLLSLFWAINQVLLASYGAFLKEHINQVSVLFAQSSTAFAGGGLLLGAMCAGRGSKNYINVGMIPLACIGITLCLGLLPFLDNRLSIVILFLFYGFLGGLLIVPLNALIQFHSPIKAAGKIQAANNFLQNCFMLTFLMITIAVGLYQIDSQYLLFSLCGLGLIITILSLTLWPQEMIRLGLKLCLRFIYRLKTEGLENIPTTGGVLLLGNHVSFMDWALLINACPRPIRFVMDHSFYERWYAHWLFKYFKMIPISPGKSSEALVEINKALNEGEVIALFPEGQLTKDGELGIFRTGFERAAVNTAGTIIPFYIQGLWGSLFSYATAKTLKRRRVSLLFGKKLPSSTKAQCVREEVMQLKKLSGLSVE